MRAFARFTFGFLIVTFFVAPLLAILPLAFTSDVFLNYPIPAFSTRWFVELGTDQAWRRSIINSLIIGSGTTFVATLLGTSAALGLRRKIVPFVGPIRTLFLLPMAVPTVVLGVGMQIVYARIGVVSSYLGVIIAHTIIAVPFVLVSVSASLAGIDRRIELAAESLGASPRNCFIEVTLPLALPGIASGAVLAFATSFDEVVLTLFVAGPNQQTLARQMFSTMQENISPAIAAAALIFITGTLVAATVVGFAQRQWRMKVSSKHASEVWVKAG
jgi:putative spermidine/putrescine transport system permease protein